MARRIRPAAGRVRDPTDALPIIISSLETRVFFVVRHEEFLTMAKCEEGYLCEVCGQDVEEITDSDLYLRFVIGLVDPETLHTVKERHIRCNPSLAQFIVDERFEPVVMEGDFDKRKLDPDYVRQRQQLVTRGWQRLHEVVKSDIPIIEYPLPEVRAHYDRQDH